MKRLLISLTLVVSFLVPFILINPPVVDAECACSITTSSPKRLAERSDAVFIGTVNRITKRGETYVAYMKIGRSLKGYQSTDQEFEVLTQNPNDSDLCGYRFKTGNEYFVYAKSDREGRYWTDRCSGSKPTSEASRDIAELKTRKIIDLTSSRTEQVANSARKTLDSSGGESNREGLSDGPVLPIMGTVLMGATILVLLSAGVGVVTTSNKRKKK